MGISAQQYRICIGTFLPQKCSSLKSRPVTSRKPNKNNHGMKYKTSVLLLLCLALIWTSTAPPNQTFNLQKSNFKYKTFPPGSCQVINYNLSAEMEIEDLMGSSSVNGMQVEDTYQISSQSLLILWLAINHMFWGLQNPVLRRLKTYKMYRSRTINCSLPILFIIQALVSAEHQFMYIMT